MCCVGALGAPKKATEELGVHSILQFLDPRDLTHVSKFSAGTFIHKSSSKSIFAKIVKVYNTLFKKLQKA